MLTEDYRILIKDYVCILIMCSTLICHIEELVY